MNDLPKLLLPDGPTDGGIDPPKREVSQPHEKLRSDGRPHDTGRDRPYRPLPADFRDRYIELGQGKEIEEHFHTNWRVIARWIDEAGGDTLRAERYKVSGGFARPGKRAESRAKRYVLGKTLSAVRKRGRKH